MKTPGLDGKCLVAVSVLLFFGMRGASNGQTPAINASTGSPLTSATLDGGQVALLLSGGAYVRSTSDIRNAVTVSGIDGATIERVNRLGDTAVTLTLGFSGHLVADGALTFTVGAQAIANYSGSALTAELPVTALKVSLTASTPFGLWESLLNGSVVTLTLVGHSYERADIRSFVSVSGLAGVTVDNQQGIERASDTEVTVELIYLGDFVSPMATDGALTFTVQAQAIANYDGPALTVDVPVTAGFRPFGHDPARDFNTLDAENRDAVGFWSDGTTMWVADDTADKIYAYDAASEGRDPARDFNALRSAGNNNPRGIWSDGTTMWVADYSDEKIYAYDLASRARDPAKNFNKLASAGNRSPMGIWSDGTTMWVADISEDKLYAYDAASKARDPAKDFSTLASAGNRYPVGIWSDGTTMWVVDISEDKLYAYDLVSKARNPAKDFNTLKAAGNRNPTGIWSDGTTMWVADSWDEKIYAYVMPSGDATPNPETSGAPRIRSLTSSGAGLSVAWNAPPGSGTAVTAYDLRYIRSDATDTADPNWTVVEEVWTPGSGPLSFELTGLTSGVQYDLQVRAVIGAANGPWSATSTGTPLTQAQVNADFNGDGIVNFADFFDFVDAFGTTDAKYDLDGNGIVNFADFFEFVDAFGTSG